MSPWKKKQTMSNCQDDLVQVKSKYWLEFRRFSIPKPKKVSSDENDEPDWCYEAFRLLLQKIHRLDNVLISLSYTDSNYGELLPINNNENFRLALTKAGPILRVTVTGENTGDLSVPRNLVEKNSFPFFGSTNSSGSYCPSAVISIGKPNNFRHVSTLMDAPELPPTQRKVKLRKSEEDGRPLGLCIRDGWTVHQTPQGEYIRTAGVYISRLIPGGLAESTGLLSVNDEILEINGIFVGDGAKTLDQVTDMIMANAADLIITIRVTDTILSIVQGHNDRSGNGQVASTPGTPNGIYSNSGKRKRNLREKRKQVSSSVFYLDESDHEDVVVSFADHLLKKDNAPA